MDLLMRFLNILKKHYLAVIYRLLLLVDSLRGPDKAPELQINLCRFHC